MTANATSSPSGARDKSTRTGQRIVRSNASTLTPRGIARSAALPKSKTYCEARATAKIGQLARQSADGSPTRPSRSAGPTACQALERWTSSRSGCQPPQRWSGRYARTKPAATRPGAQPVGSRNSIGTKSSCVGTANPSPTSNWTRSARAYAPDQQHHEPERRVAVARHEERERTSGGEERAAARRGDPEVAPAERTRDLLARLFDQSIRIGMDSCRRGRSCRIRGHVRSFVSFVDRSSLVRGISAPSTPCPHTGDVAPDRHEESQTALRSSMEGRDEGHLAAGLRTRHRRSDGRGGGCGESGGGAPDVCAGSREALRTLERLFLVHARAERQPRERVVRVVAERRRFARRLEQPLPERLLLALAAERGVCEFVERLRAALRRQGALLRAEHR